MNAFPTENGVETTGNDLLAYFECMPSCTICNVEEDPSYSLKFAKKTK